MRLATSLKLRLQDLRERDPLVPPRRLRGADENGDFAAAGDELLGHLREVAGLQPGERVLDVGCGSGQAARALAGFLGAEGTYEGFDTDPVGVGWCQTRYPANFRFRVVDRLEERFPYDDASFDFAILGGVLTHLLENEAARHLAETGRVLDEGGRAVAMLYLLDDESRGAIADERAARRFLQPEAHVAVLRDEDPEEAVAFDAAWLHEQAGQAGLRVAAVDRGTWRGDASRTSRAFTDLVLLCA